MLNSILNDPNLSNKHFFSVVLLPPISSCSKEPYSYHYLANHVIQVPFHVSNPTQYPLQTLDGSSLKFNRGCIIFAQVQSKILYSKLLYNMHAQCTHLILYLDKDIMDQKNAYRLDRLQPAIGATVCSKLFPILDQLVAQFSKVSKSCHTIQSLRNCTQSILGTGWHFLESFQDEKTNLEDMCVVFENIFMEEIYDVVFFKITQIILEQDRLLSGILEDLEYLDYSQISLPNLREARSKVQHATDCFERIGSLRSPVRKLDCLLSTIEALNQEDFLSTDSLVPLFLMTMISSKLPHLLANLCYMKDFIFKTDISCGTYGYSLSTFEAVLSFIPNSNIHELSLNNRRLWARVQASSYFSFETYYSDLATLEPRDRQGNNIFLRACLEGRTHLVNWILLRQGGAKISDRNDLGMTPLMCAVQSRSDRTFNLLLKDAHVRETLDVLDKEGNSVLMYLGQTQNVELLETLLACGKPSPRNDRTGQTVIHFASCSSRFIDTVFCHYKGAEDWTDSAGNTVYHVCRDPLWLEGAPSHALDRLNLQGQSPLFVWASEGRLDLLYPFLEQAIKADRTGQSVLHVIAAALPKGITGRLEIIYHYRDQIETQDWPDHNTPLHIALEQATLTSAPLVLQFVRILCDYGASLDFKNVKGERPVDLCRLPDLCQSLDGLMTRPISVKYQTRWRITRSVIKDDGKLYFVIHSHQRGCIKTVEKQLEDFFFLRRRLLSKTAELFLPPLADLVDSTGLPFLVRSSVMTRLDSFMNWILHHPTLSCHPLVLSFVGSFTREEKKKKEVPTAVIVGSGQDEACFFRYIFDSILPLKSHYAHLLTVGRRVANIKQVDIRAEWIQTLNYLGRVTQQDPVIGGTMQICATVMCGYTVLSSFIQQCQTSHDVMNGILISLRNPLDLIEHRRRIKLENEKKQSASLWQLLIHGQEQNTKEIDCQIIQSHQTVSDELAHFQRIHSKMMIKILKKEKKKDKNKMGCCQSVEEGEEKQKSREIDVEIKIQRDNMKRQIKMLLLGAGESGKSTILKQMKLIHDGGYSQEERESFKEVIFSNTVQSMIVTLEAMDSLGIPFQNENKQQILVVFKAPPQVDALDQELVDALATLWEDAGVRECVDRASEFQLNDSARYYFDSVLRIGHPHYIPSDQDLLRSRVKSTGITETTFIIGSLTYRMLDVGGQRSERKKWIHCFENVTALLFLVAISEYDQVLFEDASVNRLQESLTLFDSICNSRWFIKTSIILFLNKIDLFAEKLIQHPLASYFDDYHGNGYQDACHYLSEKFLALNTRDTKRIYTHLTCATDTQQIKFVMAAVNDIIVHEDLRQIGLL